MAKVGAKIGLTLKLYKDKDSYEFWRPEVEISDIDTEKPVIPQIQQALEALDEVYKAVEGKANAQIEEQKKFLEKEIERRISNAKRRDEDS